MSDFEKTIPRFKAEDTQISKETGLEPVYLLGIEGPHAGSVFTLSQSETIVGREPGKEGLSLNDSQVSRKHAVFRRSDEAVIVEDLGSTNGTLVNGDKIGQEVRLTEGDHVVVGQSKLRFSVLNPIEGTQMGLLNHGYFERRLHEELDRSVRYKRPISLLMLKMFPVSPQADEDLLAQSYSMLVNHVRKVIRTMDILAHYGKYELEISLPETSYEEALKLAQRIALHIKMHPNLRLCIGMAAYPENGASKDILLQESRAALKACEQNRTQAVVAAKPNSTKSLGTQSSVVVKSPNMQKVFDMAERVARSTITVLVLGETGVGKEVVAEAIHKHSPRSSKALVCVNCAALTETLLESELFGHEKGAFTGADQTKIGLFETASGGTIFLDEVGEMPGKTQAKLLRVLQAKTIMRVGSNKEIATDVRVVAATNRNLEQQVKAGQFREDLFYRLNAATIEIPPLRERIEDIGPLSEFFIQSFCDENEFPHKKLSPQALRLLEAYAWPGNIRELKNTIERAVIISEDEEIGTEVLMGKIGGINVSSGQSSSSQSLDAPAAETQLGDMKQVVGDYERRLIVQALRSTGWNQTKAADVLNVPRRTLVSKIKKYDISEEDDA